MGIGFIFQVWQIAHCIKFGERDTTGDPWDGRTLEWSIPSPAPVYNFAVVPEVDERDAFWEDKERREFAPAPLVQASQLEAIHMPRNSGVPFIFRLSGSFAGFGFVFDWMWMAFAGLAGVGVTLLIRSFQYDTDYYIPVGEKAPADAVKRLRGGRYNGSTL